MVDPKEKQDKNDKSLNEFKELYEQIRKKNSLPEFRFLNENFDIESIAHDETELIIKRIRKQIMEKIAFGLRALEMFLNAQNAPMFIFSIIKSFSQSDKEIIEGLYERLAEFEIESFGLDNKYDEVKEIELIKRITSEWPEISDELDKIYQAMKFGFKQEKKKQSKSYFG